MMTDAGAVAEVVMATGYVVSSVGSVHASAGEQAAVGAVMAEIEVMLPVVENVPAFARVTLPLVANCVAEMVTCQPAPVPVASSTRYDWSTVVGSTRFRSRPFSVPPHARALDEVRFRPPAVRVSVPVSEQVVPAATADPHPAASAVPEVSRTAPPIPPVSSTQAPRRRATRLLVICIDCLIAVPSPPEVKLLFVFT